MNFRRDVSEEPLEVNLIPLIDVLLVILIFLAVTTTFNRYSQLEVALPQVQEAALPEDNLTVTVGRDGTLALAGRVLGQPSAAELAQSLRSDSTQTSLVIQADAQAHHQAVIQVLEAARIAGLEKVVFATQTAQ